MEVKPFTDEELEMFKHYCDTVFGLHFVGDTLKKHTVIDGDKVVHQVRQAVATIEQMRPIYELAMMLPLMTRKNGTLIDGFKAREVLLEINKHWEEQNKL